MPKLDLLATKLHVPPIPAQAVERPHLVKRLSDGLALKRTLTLVSAPAGFGKTSCVVEWVGGLVNWSVAWLSLDPADDDPGRFFTYLLGALQSIAPGVGQEIVGVLRSGQLPPAEVISTVLINDLLRSADRLLLVLDDLHVIQDALILQVLEQLLENWPPHLHLVLLTREDPPLPLARLRAGNRLTEIRAHHLRFSEEEATGFLNEKLALSLSAADVARLEAKTEGWIAGLQLAALAVQATERSSPTSTRRPDDSSHFITSLSGGNRYILDYLTEQVLDRQPPDIRHFLLQTSMLDRLHGDLCDAVTGRADGHSRLQQLFAANLFLVPLDEEGQWYRYHHLFADLLRSRHRNFTQAERAGLHLRASRWYSRAGLPTEAIRHALAADAYDRVVELLEAHARELVMQGYAKTVHGWLKAVPAGWRRQSTRTELTFAWMHLLRGAYAEAAPYLERAGNRLSEQSRDREKPSLLAEWSVMRSLVLQMEGGLAEAERLARQALAVAPENDAHARSLAYFALGSVLLLTEKSRQAIDAYQRAIQAARAADNPVAEMLSTVGLAGMAFEQGRLHLAVEIARPVVASLEEAGTLFPISSVLYGMLAEAHYQWHRLEEAWRYNRRALELSTLGGYQSGRVICRVGLCRLAQLEGDLEAAGRELQQVSDLVQKQLPDYVRQELVAQQVRLYLARNRPDAARLALSAERLNSDQEIEEAIPSRGVPFTDPFPLPAPAPGRRIGHAAGLLYNSGLRLLLYEVRAGGDRDTLQYGIRLADRLLAATTEEGHVLVVLETLLLRAQMQAISGDAAASTSDYAQAVALAEPEEIVGAFVEQGAPVAAALAHLLDQKRLDGASPAFVERIIALTEARLPEAQQPTGAQALVEPLSERELEVLQLIADGLKYKEIAATLFISLNTVRFHVKAIYGKLSVNKRTQAVEKARLLHIL